MPSLLKNNCHVKNVFTYVLFFYVRPVHQDTNNSSSPISSCVVGSIIGVLLGGIVLAITITL